VRTQEDVGHDDRSLLRYAERTWGRHYIMQLGYLSLDELLADRDERVDCIHHNGDGNTAIHDDRTRIGSLLNFEAEQGMQTRNRKNDAAQICDADERLGRLRYARRRRDTYHLDYSLGW
jgi:hypothetical protein